jgi:hypothetical protein
MKDASHIIQMEFGEPEWRAYLGGGFLGPEKSGSISWNWLSDRRAWCVLPPLDSTRDYLLRLEAAPVAFYGTMLWDVQLFAEEVPLARRVLALEENEASLSLPTKSVFQKIGTMPEMLRVSLRKLGQPRLDVFLNDLPLAHLQFQIAPYVQPHEILLRHELLAERNVLAFEASYAVAPQDVDPSSSDKRQLSFRMFRLQLRTLE